MRVCTVCCGSWGAWYFKTDPDEHTLHRCGICEKLITKISNKDHSMSFIDRKPKREDWQ